MHDFTAWPFTGAALRRITADMRASQFQPVTQKRRQQRAVLMLSSVENLTVLCSISRPSPTPRGFVDLVLMVSCQLGQQFGCIGRGSRPAHVIAPSAHPLPACYPARQYKMHRFVTGPATGVLPIRGHERIARQQCGHRGSNLPDMLVCATKQCANRRPQSHLTSLGPAKATYPHSPAPAQAGQN